MKNSLITLAFVFYMSAIVAQPANSVSEDPDSLYCLELDGRIMNAGSGDEACHVELLCRNELSGEAILKPGKKRFIFYLKREEFYTLKLTMKGHLPKIICIDTKKARVANDEDELFYFGFETELEKNNDALNKQVADFPVAVLYFDEKRKVFDYNKEYTESIKKELYAKK